MLEDHQEDCAYSFYERDLLSFCTSRVEKDSFRERKGDCLRQSVFHPPFNENFARYRDISVLYHYQSLLFFPANRMHPLSYMSTPTGGSLIPALGWVSHVGISLIHSNSDVDLVF